MILLRILEVFIISASSLFLFLSSFSYRIFKNGRLSGASFQHNSSNDQYRSGDSNSLAYYGNSGNLFMRKSTVRKKICPDIIAGDLQLLPDSSSS